MGLYKIIVFKMKLSIFLFSHACLTGSGFAQKIKNIGDNGEISVQNLAALNDAKDVSDASGGLGRRGKNPLKGNKKKKPKVQEEPTTTTTTTTSTSTTVTTTTTTATTSTK